MLDDAGFTGTLASNSEFEIIRYLRVGDELHGDDGHRVDLRGEADPPRRGHFVTWVTTYTTPAARSSGANGSASSSSSRRQAGETEGETEA